MDIDEFSQDICRVCRSEASADKPLFHPCICTGSIKYIHQDCLVQWLKFSKNEYCELCNYKFSFIPIYSADMPKRIPLKDILSEIFSNLLAAIKSWIHYTIVAVTWLIFVPVFTFRIVRFIFYGYVSSHFSLSVDIFSTENIITDIFYGITIVLFTITVFIGLVWLREQIIREVPDWLRNLQPLNETDNELLDNENNNINDNNNNQLNNLDNFNQNNIENQYNDHEELEENRVVVFDQSNLINIVDNIENNDDDNNLERENNSLIQNEFNWNQQDMDWNVEEYNFDRIFGFDGSLTFLDHVIWVLFLNMLFVFIFAFLPYYIGLFFNSKLNIIDIEFNNNFKNILIMCFGYLIIGILSILLHTIMYQRFQRAWAILGMNYLIIKVAISAILELIVLPIICGILLNICSLPLFASTIAERKEFFKNSPGISIFFHWFIGFMFFLYVFLFLLILRSILRPSLTWFFDSLNNPNFNPIHEMIHMPLIVFVKKFMFTLAFFIIITFLMVFQPILVVEKLFPGFLPYNFFSSKTQKDSSFEYVILQFITYLVLDRNKIKNFIVSIVKFVCISIAYILDLKSFLIGDAQIENDDLNENNGDIRENNNDLYIVPNHFYLRIIGLIILTCFSIFMNGFLIITVPVALGRNLNSLFMGDYKVHEINTIGCGIYLLLFVNDIINLIRNWMSMGWNAIYLKIRGGFFILIKSFTTIFLLFGLIPLLIGLLLEVMILIPIKVPYEQTPVYNLFYDWFLGFLIIKLIFSMAVFGDWNFREIQEIYEAGFANIDLKKIIEKLILPISISIGLILSIPYVFVNGILYYFNFSYETCNFILRQLYMFIWCSAGIIYLLHCQVYNFFRLYEHIKNDKYLIGRRLINYDPSKKTDNLIKRSLLSLN